MPVFYKRWFYRGRLALIKSMLGKPQPKPMTFIGPGSSAQLSRVIAQFGVRSLLIVTDKPLRELGLLDSTISALAAQGVRTEIYDGVLRVCHVRYVSTADAVALCALLRKY